MVRQHTMPFPFSLRRRKAPAAPVEPVAAEPPLPPPAPPSLLWRLLTPLGVLWEGVRAFFRVLDRALCWFAIPFGVHVRDPRRRYAILLGLFALIYIAGALPISYLPLAALAFGYVGVLGINRAWVLNEKKRTAIVKKLLDADPDQMPDLRWTALVAVLQLIILFPLLFMQVEREFHWYKVSEPATFWSWLWFSIDKTYLKALPDWSMLYGVHISSIDFDARWGRHLVLLTRLTFDYVLIQGILRVLAIRLVIHEAVSAVKADPELAVRLGRRAIKPLVEKLRDPDRAVRGAAANALTQLGQTQAIHQASA